MIELPPNTVMVEQEVLCIVAHEAQKELTAKFKSDGYDQFYAFDGYPDGNVVVIVRDSLNVLPPLAFRMRKLPHNYNEACALF